jgi:hypothetical protein
MSPIFAAFEWQTMAVGALIGMATVYLTRRYWKAWTSREKQSCGGGCGTCSTGAESKPLVTLKPLPPEKIDDVSDAAQKKASGTA